MAIVLGVTGGISTGKSTVVGLLRELGADVLSADEIAREVVARDGPAYSELVDRFGPGILEPSGEIDRKALGEIIFADADARQTLNDITHPRIIEIMRERIDRFRARPPDPDALLAVEIPLLVECGLEDMVDQVLLVAAEQEVQVGRLTTRSGVSREEALRRAASQMPISEKLLYADHVIWNSGSLEDLEQKVRSFWEEIRSA